VGLADAVDAALRDMSTLLGSGPAPSPRSAAPMSNPPAAPAWEGAASQSATLISAQLDDQRRALYSAHQAAAQTITQAGQISTESRRSMNSVLAEWENDKAAAGPMMNTPEGQAWLAAAGQTRLGEASGVIQQALMRFGEASQQLGAITAGLPNRGGAPRSPATTTPGPENPNKEKIDDLYKKLGELNIKISAHNLNPPLPNDPAAVEQYNEKYEELMSELLKLQTEFALYGIDLIINPPSQGGTR
jgi:hypothetical protein